MYIRKAVAEDINQIMEIYSNARIFMAEHNNSTQWGTTYPPLDLVKETIASTYLCLEDDVVACVFYYATEDDASYRSIYNGAWLNSESYGVVHRIASTHKVKGSAKFCLNWAFAQCGNLKIDTHKNNIPMQNLLKSLGFSYCGIIYCDHSGDEMLAYQKAN